MKKETDNKYLERKLQLIHATLAGSCMGANLSGLEGHIWHYDNGTRGRAQIEKDVRELYRYAFGKGRKSVLKEPKS